MPARVIQPPDQDDDIIQGEYNIVSFLHLPTKLLWRVLTQKLKVSNKAKWGPQWAFLLGCVGDKTVSVHTLIGFGQVVGSVC